MAALDEHEIYSMRTRKGETVAEWAVSRHVSAAAKVLRDEKKYIEKLGDEDGHRLIMRARAKMRQSKT